MLSTSKPLPELVMTMVCISSQELCTLHSLIYILQESLTHLPPGQNDCRRWCFQNSNAFFLMKSFVFWFKFHWGLFLRVQLTVLQHWFIDNAWRRPGNKPLSELMLAQFTDVYMQHYDCLANASEAVPKNVAKYIKYKYKSNENTCVTTKLHAYVI